MRRFVYIVNKDENPCGSFQPYSIILRDMMIACASAYRATVLNHITRVKNAQPVQGC